MRDRILPKERTLPRLPEGEARPAEEEVSSLTRAVRRCCGDERALGGWLRRLVRWEAQAARLVLVRELGPARAARVWERAHVS